MAASGVPGVAYAVVTDGEITSAGARGVVEAGTDREVTPDTPFAAGSITKSVTALAVMQQVEAGQVDLDAAVERYLDLRRALDAGVGGYLLKDAPSATLADTIRTVHHGGRAVDPTLAAEGWAEPDPLPDRERQVLRLAGDGLSNADIAARVHLPEGTVRNYLSEAMRKLGASNRTAAARLARDRGWL